MTELFRPSNGTGGDIFRHNWLVKKGGQNGPPREPRPPPPRSLRLSPGTAEGRAKGGVARAEALTPERRAEIARNANAKRWKWS